MKKKLLYAAAAVAAALLIVWGIQAYTSAGKSTGSKQITIIAIDEGSGNKELIHETVSTDAKTLHELLQEKTEFKAVLEDGPYGAFLISLAGAEQNSDSGPWWVFESDNNKVCVSAGMCPAMDQVTIEDQDAFTFRLTSSFE